MSKLTKENEESNELKMVPGFQYAGRKFCLLNSGFEVKINGVYYHLSSKFSGKGEMGAVIDAIELERSSHKTIALKCKSGYNNSR